MLLESAAHALSGQATARILARRGHGLVIVTGGRELGVGEARRAEQTQRVYEQPYGSFSYDRQRFNRITDAILRACLRPGSVACDVGCGSGYWLQRMHAAAGGAADLHGTDLAAPALRQLRGRGFGLVRGDVLALPYRSGGFDFVFSGGVIHHTVGPELAFREIARVVKPGGRFLIEVYNAWHPYFYLVHRGTWPVRALYWSGWKFLLPPLRLLAALPLQLLALVLTRRRMDRASIDTLVRDQILTPIALLFTRGTLERYARAAGVEVEHHYTKQWGIMRGVLCRKPEPAAS